MCLSVDVTKHKQNGFHFSPIRAEQDITVFKLVIRGLQEEGYSSPFKDNFKWELGHVYAIDNERRLFSDSCLLVHYGFHSCTTLLGIRNILGDNLPYCDRLERGVIMNAVIPKGSLYFHGVRDDMVSSQLKLIGLYEGAELRAFERYLSYA